MSLIKKYDLNDYIISIIYKNKDEVQILSKINLNNSFKVNSQKYYKIDLNIEKDLQRERSSFYKLLDSENAKIGMTAFLNKLKPEWKD